MSGDFDKMTDRDFRDSLGDLSDGELEALRSELGDEKVDPSIDSSIDGLLRRVAEESVAAEDEVPPIPDRVMGFFEGRKQAALDEVAAEEAALEESIYSRPRADAPKPERRGFFERLRIPLGIGALGAAAAAVVLALTWNEGNRSESPAFRVAMAGSVSLLTPGEVTGFTEPIFSWKADNGGAVDVEVVEVETGDTVATLANAFSPLRWSAMGAGGSLRAGATYELRLSEGGNPLAARSFRTSGNAAGAPHPAESIDRIVAQCEELVAENRHADAWMLWGELTEEEKRDPRMQDLRERILAVIEA